MKIYVVDDDRRLVKLVSDSIIKMLQLESRHFDNPLLALSASIESPPDLLIVDMMMPTMDGISLVRELRKLGIMCKVIMLTGYKTAALSKVLPTNNIASILEKPCSIQNILNTVKLAIEQPHQELVAHS